MLCGESRDEEEFFQMMNTPISYQTGVEIMTLAKKMLDEGVDAAFAAKISGLSLDLYKTSEALELHRKEIRFIVRAQIQEYLDRC